MTCGIILYHDGSAYWSCIIADDTLYDGMYKDLTKLRRTILRGKKGIQDEQIDEISDQVTKMVEKLNKGVSMNIERELHSVF